MLLVFAWSVLLVLVLFTLYCRYCYYGRKLSEIPGPRRWPLIGNAVETAFLNPETAFTYARRCRMYGPISKLTSFLVSVVNISDPDYVEKLLSTYRYNDKKTPYNFMRTWLCEGLLVSNGEKWKQRRKLLTPAFHFEILKSFCSTFNEQAERFLQLIDKETEEECIDITPLISRTTLNVMCETSMGTSVHSKDSESTIEKYFNALFIFGNIIQKRIVTVWLHFDWVHKLLPLARTEKKLVADMHALTNKVIQDRRNLRDNNDVDGSVNGEVSSKKPRLAMLDHLLELEKEGKIDENGIREEVDTFMFEGHDTTSSALSFMIMRIANETKVQDRIYKELHQIFGDSQRVPTIEDLNQMRFLDCCIKESLRLYPGVPLIARYISEDINLGGYTVPQGAVAFIHVYDIHHDPDLYPDPEMFDPDRFLPEKCAGRHPFAYIPFSAGPRNCIGQKFAMYEIKTLMSSLLRRYRLEAVTRPQDVTFIADLVLRSKDPLYVRIRRRQP
ncbi:hypothetical protein O0L34_g11284 [Tuta absoluta]|nr:hypothetical protein O0L34_g11284 [Tuta absoluta]